jgi:23S rRNA (uracil1939-C5)-methyltransferase
VDPEGYRTTVRVAAGLDGRPGFRAERSHEIVPAPACLVAHPRLAELLPGLRLAPDVEATLRTSVVTGELNARWTGGDGDGLAVDGLPAGTPTGSSAAIREDVNGHRLRVSMGSFFQSGPQAAALLVDTVRRCAPELTGARLVVDAYAGVGVLAACATDPATRIIAVETSRSAVADARHNLAGREAEIVRGEVGGWRPAGDRAVDVVIADPARSGLGRPGVGALGRTGAPVLVLVSCDPASLGRDAKLLTAAGYRHDRTDVVDTFPHTTHVEAVTRFVRV